MTGRGNMTAAKRKKTTNRHQKDDKHHKGDKQHHHQGDKVPSANGQPILFSRTWHEEILRIGKEERIDPEILEGFGYTYQLIMNLSEELTAALYLFTTAGMVSNRSGMKRFLRRISNRKLASKHSGIGNSTTRNRADSFATKAIESENSGAYTGWEEGKRREHISKILFSEKFGVSWEQALKYWGDDDTKARPRRREQGPLKFHDVQRPQDFHADLWSRADERMRKRKQRQPKLELKTVGQILEKVVQLLQRVDAKYRASSEPVPTTQIVTETDRTNTRRHSHANKKRTGFRRRVE